MLILVLAVADAAPTTPALPPDEERRELESLDELRLGDRHVPAWPVIRQRRSPEGAFVGLAFAAVGGVLVATLIPDYAYHRQAYGPPCWNSGSKQILKQCI